MPIALQSESEPSIDLFRASLKQGKAQAKVPFQEDITHLCLLHLVRYCYAYVMGLGGKVVSLSPSPAPKQITWKQLFSPKQSRQMEAMSLPHQSVTCGRAGNAASYTCHALLFDW